MRYRRILDVGRNKRANLDQSKVIRPTLGQQIDCQSSEILSAGHPIPLDDPSINDPIPI